MERRIFFLFRKGSMRLTHKITVFSHIFEAVNYHKKRKTKQSALHTDLVNRHTICFIFPNALIHTQNLVSLKFTKNYTQN